MQHPHLTHTWERYDGLARCNCDSVLIDLSPQGDDCMDAGGKSNAGSGCRGKGEGVKAAVSCHHRDRALDRPSNRAYRAPPPVATPAAGAFPEAAPWCVRCPVVPPPRIL